MRRVLLLVALWGLVSPAHAGTLYATHPGEGTACTAGVPCSLATALCNVAAGDTIILKNGTYTGINSMLVPPTGKAGTASQRIIVQAETDGGVLLDGQRLMRPVSLGTGVGYWTLKGLNACCAHDTTIMIGQNANNIRLERVIAWDQEDATAGVITIWGSTDTVLQDVAAWGHGKKMLAVVSDTRTIVNRGFFFKYDTKVAPDNGGVVMTYANQSPVGNKFFNTITATDLPVGFNANLSTAYALVAPDAYPNTTPTTATHMLKGNIAYHVDGQNVATYAALMRNSLLPANVVAAGSAIRTENQNNLTMRRAAAIPATGHDCPGDGIKSTCVQDNWTDSSGALTAGPHTTEGGTVTPSAAPDLLRLAATTQPADGAWIKHCHFEDGTLDFDCNVWPWPMNARIQVALVASGRGLRGLDGLGGTDLTARILALAGSSLGPTEVLHATYTQQPQSKPLGTPLPGISACVYNAENVLQVGFAAALTIALQVNPSAATLVGTLTQVPTSGCATWNNLTVDTAGTGYTLRVTSPGVTSVDSTPFNITTIPPTVVGNRVRVIR